MEGAARPTETRLLGFFPLRVYVAESLISSAGEGLFSKAATEPNVVMSFYNGVRITHQEVSVEEMKICVIGFKHSSSQVLRPLHTNRKGPSAAQDLLPSRQGLL